MNSAKTRTKRIALGAGVAGLCIAAGAAFGGGPRNAFADDAGGRRGGHGIDLTEEQKACMQEQGLTGRPDGRPTVEEREAFRAAAENCGVELRGLGHRVGRHRADKPELTEEQKACMQEQGITERPQGQPTVEEREAFKAAAENCGIELHSGGPGSGRCTPPALADESLAS